MKWDFLIHEELMLRSQYTIHSAFCKVLVYRACNKLVKTFFSFQTRMSVCRKARGVMLMVESPVPLNPNTKSSNALYP